MAEDLNNNKDIYFPSNLGTNDKLISLLNRASQTLCDWFSKADKNGPLPLDESFNCIMPAEDGNSEEDLFSDIESLLNNSFNPVHPGSLAHLDPPPLIFSILGDLIAAGLNNNCLLYTSDAADEHTGVDLGGRRIIKSYFLCKPFTQ